MIRLFSYWRSTSAWRVRIAVAYKQIPCAIVPVHLLRDGGEHRLPVFLARNPLAQVPVLELDQRPNGPTYLTQSMAILEYLEERHPAPPLMPSDPFLRARTRQLAEVVNSGTQPLQNMKLQQELRTHGVDPLPLVRGFIRAGLQALEQIAGPTAGRFLVGDAPTLADLYLVPQLYNARRYSVTLDGLPLLLRVEQACAALPAFAAAHPDAQPDYDASAPP